MEQNTLIPSREYDYAEPKEIIDISETSLFSKLDTNTASFFSRENANKEDCLPRGFSVRPGSSKKEFFFDYYMFPALLSEKLFKYNCKNYKVPTIIYSKKMEELNRSIIRNCFIKFDDYKKVFYGTWAGLSFPIFIGSLRTNLIYLIQNLAVCGFFVIKCIEECTDDKIWKGRVAGILELVTGFFSIYLCFSQIINEHFKKNILTTIRLKQDNEIDFDTMRN